MAFGGGLGRFDDAVSRARAADQKAAEPGAERESRLGDSDIYDPEHTGPIIDGASTKDEASGMTSGDHIWKFFGISVSEW